MQTQPDENQIHRRTRSFIIAYLMFSSWVCDLVLPIHVMKTAGIMELFQGLKSMKRLCYAAVDVKGIYSVFT